ncbi:hypothetical protein FHW16_003625 [Phyllobacterium myrsinacearum]|uniref:Uncharacterized protein n=1 Tax=Phyllobacterium myrsinacearum TaxID=28101 RepID=A0A839ER89_9HYPH|nr:hypothetical protein [Phyllobacterium myrsinacearum]
MSLAANAMSLKDPGIVNQRMDCSVLRHYQQHLLR